MSRQGGVPYMSNLTAHRPDFFKSITIYFKHHEKINYYSFGNYYANDFIGTIESEAQWKCMAE